MKSKEIKTDKDLNDVALLFSEGATLVSVNYTAKSDGATVNALRSATLEFSANVTFRLKFSGINCLHLAPIAVGSISVSEVSVGRIGKLFFWADDPFFNVTEPDTSLSYVIAESVFVEI